MNCKPGDLAVVIKSVTGANLGRIVRCVELLPAARVEFPDGIHVMPAWRLGERVQGWRADPRGALAPDTWLRPICDNDGADETLTWVGLPAKPEQVAA